MKTYKELLSGDSLQEAIQSVLEGRDFICVHAKKGKIEIKNASSAYDAAQKAAKKWGLKSTAGIDSHLAEELEEAKKCKKEDNTNDVSDDGEGLDKVQPKAVKKKFKDRKDKDIDNDGDVDDSDEYIHKKRKAISKAIAKEDVDKADETPSGADDDAEDEAPKKKKKAKKDEKDTPSVKDSGAEVVDTEPKLDENYYTEKYGDRAQAVMEAVAEKLANK